MVGFMCVCVFFFLNFVYFLKMLLLFIVCRFFYFFVCFCCVCVTNLFFSCNHPFLLEGAEESMTPTHAIEDTVYNNLINASGKFLLLDKLLSKFKKEKNRVLIFSQMSRVLDIMEDYLNYRNHSYERLDGSVTGIERQEAIDRFTNDDSVFAFILTTKAGGVGINLTAADRVIIFDSDWNPMNDLQAIARCHRIGQTKQVKVYRLVIRNSYEEQMWTMADKKMGLTLAHIQNMLQKDSIFMLSNYTETHQNMKKQMLIKFFLFHFFFFFVFF